MKTIRTDIRLLGFPVTYDTDMPVYVIDLRNPDGHRLRITFDSPAPEERAAAVRIKP